ncbi:hypothetical protein LA345_41320 (plasmid) [Burkholderia vietnamiensis]|nr:hypothetical protein [Burkholderia vietnamiensis]
MARSADPEEQRAAAQLMQLLELARSNPGIRERLMGSWETVTVRSAAGETQQVDIKLIKCLKDIADDDRYHTDAIRRIRDLINKPADRYRVFFAQRKSRNGCFVFQVLGVFHREVAYLPATLNELKKRYES